ncbi:MAG: glycosyltransferase [Bacteroidales bacterium]|nr:glycosyltransferase [Bacteroidales bacterium]
MKKIVIQIITYNQEDLIRRALDSILCQKEWGLYRIVVSDDCSKDRTWEVLQEYQQKYPEIIDAHRNEHNLGIYPNLVKSDSYLPDDFDLLGMIAGDDSLCDGYFEGVQKLIEEQGVDTTEAIGIISDWIFVKQGGQEVVVKQDAVLSGHNLWSLKIRGKLAARSLLISKKLFDRFEPGLEGKGLNLTESHRDAQAFLYADKMYYLPKATSKYYAGIGVSVSLSNKKSDYSTKQAIEKWEYDIEHYVKDKRDMHYAQFGLMQAQHYLKPSLGKIPKILYHYGKGQLKGCRDDLRTTAKVIYYLLFTLF